MIIVFTRPQYLILLMAIPILIFVHIIALKSIRKRAIKFANFEAISKIRGVEIFSKNLTILYLNIIIIVMLVFSVSGISLTRNIETSELSFVLAIDASGSMASSDIFPSRLEAAKKAGVDFLQMIPEKTRVGVVSFSGAPFIEQEVIDEKSEIKKSIERIQLKQVSGTDIFNAVLASANMLREEDSKAVILISDGQANINALQDIIDYSNKNNVVIHSLGVGTREGVVGEAGETFKISEDTLKTISHNTGGNYYLIKDVDDFYSSLNEIITITRKKDVKDLSLYFMIGALSLFVLNFALVNTRFRGIP